MTYRSRDSDTSSLLLWGLINSTVVHEFSTVLLGQVFRDSSGQSGLSVIDVLVISSGLPILLSNIHQWYQCYIVSFSSLAWS